MNEFLDNPVEMLNEHLGGFNKVMGLRFVHAGSEKIVAELEIGTQHRQPYGIVHGGVYTGMVETICSTGAAINVIADGKTAVGLENTTAFLKAVRSGKLHGTAKPLVRGRRSHVWEAQIHDDRNRLVATGRVRLIVLEPGSKADGVEIRIEDNE